MTRQNRTVGGAFLVINSYCRDDIRRAATLKLTGISCLDVGKSGGVWDSARGYRPMIDGEDAFASKFLSAHCYQFGSHDEKARAGLGKAA